MYKPQWLPPGYVLDESDPDTVTLRRTDGSFVAAFSARGVTKEGVLKAVKEDCAEEDCGEHEQEKPDRFRRGMDAARHDGLVCCYPPIPSRSRT